MQVCEPVRSLPVQGRFDVVVCGGGPAGIAAAISSARSGARTCLIEHQGFLGGVWTAGLLSVILDAGNKPGLMAEIRKRLYAMGAVSPTRDLYDAEAMKLLLEELCVEAGVEVRLYCRLAGADTGVRKIRHVILEAKEGRFALAGACFVDATGDGDLAALAGCGFDLGREADGMMQPMTLMAVVAGVPDEVRTREYGPSASASCLPKKDFLGLLQQAGLNPSYTQPSLFPLPNGLCALMVNHQYECSGLDSRDLTRATVEARREVHQAVKAMRTFSPAWHDLRLVATAPHIGIREGRRIHGLYRVTAKDIIQGTRHPDAVARVTFGVDVHSLHKGDGGGYGSGGIPHSQPYDIPLRALIARDIDNLVMAGRCISGDFLAHASYRVTGNAVTTGEAAGMAAALASQKQQSPGLVPFDEIRAKLRLATE
jgi:hypothetical protein